MNITYLIGNGFDLNLGLKTKYADFLQEYRNIESGDLVIGKFKSDIANNLKHWADAESAFGEYTERFNDVIMKRIHISPANLFEPMKDLVNRKENKIFSEVPV